MTVKELFDAAVDLPPDQRATFLDEQCAGDPQLRAAVQSLLDAHDQAGQFLAGPTVDSAHSAASARSEGALRQIGPYRLLQEIGEGGFGTVYMAEQEQPVRRRVALKIIKLGMDTQQVIARFDAEKQALAVMDHPNIAKVFDAGATETGRPYFVMELVAGIPITEYCDKNKLEITARLELFAQVCQAVQHAHTKGIIHRDIKPTNVLVSTQDGKPFAKVIDFGIAKATQSRLTEKTLFTEFRQLVGTPEYMSPEQAEGNLDVDTRSDVYSLGVLLYELLTGTTPFDGRELRSKAYAEIQRVIREVEPPRPSTRLSMSQQTIASVAALRGVEPRRLSRRVRGELDWIVMKCLEKDRSRRYETAAGLAADIAHHLADEPVDAGPPSASWRVRKFVRRHRLLLGAAAVIVAALSAGLAVATWGLVRATRERDAAIEARKAEAEAREYERQSDKFLTEMFTSLDPQQSRGRDVLVKDILDRAAQRIEKEPPTHKVVEASLRFTFGNAYHALGLNEQARIQLQRALELYRSAYGASHVSVMRTLNLLGLTLKELGRQPEAESQLRESLQMHRALLGADHADTLAVQSNLALTLALWGKYDEADSLLSDVLERMKRTGGVDAETRLTVFNDLSTLRAKQGRYPEAATLLRDALTEVKTTFGADHPWTIALTNNLADNLRSQGLLSEALALQQGNLELAQKVFGIDHPSTLTLGNQLGLSLEAAGRHDEAERIYLDTIERRTRVLGENHPATLLVRSNYGLLLQNTKRYDEAEAMFRDVTDRMKQSMGPTHPDTLIAENNIAWLRVQRGDASGGEVLFRDLLPRVRQALGDKHPLVVSISMRLGHALSLQQKWQDAEPLLADAYAAASAQGVAARQAGYASAYGICLAHLGKAQQALPLLLQAEGAARAMPKPDPVLLERIAAARAMVEPGNLTTQPSATQP